MNVGAYWVLPDDAEKPKGARMNTERYIKQKLEVV